MARQNMKEAYKDALDRYAENLDSATKKEKLEAWYNQESVAGDDALDALVELDFSGAYNTGVLPESLPADRRKYYEWFIEDWNLPPVNERNPNIWINLNQILADEREASESG